MSSAELDLEKTFGSSNVEQSKRKLSTGGKILIGLSGEWKNHFDWTKCLLKPMFILVLTIWIQTFAGGAAIGISFICAPFVAPAFRKYCLPYVPATNNQLNNVLRLIQANSNDKLLDIGSGDGRIVIGMG